MGNAGPKSLTASATVMPTCHVGAGSGLVDKHQSVGIEVELALEPGPALAQDVGPLLLGGVCGLFLRVMLWRSKNRQTAETLITVPRAASASRVSSNVRSEFVSISARIKPCCASISPDRVSPGGLATPCPCATSAAASELRSQRSPQSVSPLPGRTARRQSLTPRVHANP